MIRRLAHLCLHTDNLERLVAFYRDTLGLPVKFHFAAADGTRFGAYVSAGDSTFLEFFDRKLSARQWGAGGEPAPITSGNHFDHLCFEVTDLHGFRADLLARGVSIGEVRTGGDHSLQAWLSDPDGNRIELMEYTRRSTQLAPGHEAILHFPK